MGKKDPSRKAPKRKPAKAALDPDLVELATMLDEQRLAKNAQGWFSVPWRDGWNAAQLAHELYWAQDNAANFGLTTTVAAELTVIIGDRRATAETYWWISEALTRTGHWPEEPSIDLTISAPILRAALRCVQLIVSRSDGGGENFNAVLLIALEGFYSDDIEQIVERYRCQDAIGGSTGALDYTRRSNAFKIAWRRGLYRAAYAL